MCPGFFFEDVTASAEVHKVESFGGWFMSYKSEVFGDERFDEKLSGYAFREDVDFSYRVAKRGYLLVQTPKARIEHFKRRRSAVALRPAAVEPRKPALPAPEEHAGD